MPEQKPKQADWVVLVILAILGAFYLLAPHNVHVSSGIGLDLDHSVHTIAGVILLLVAAGYYASKTGLLKKQ
ncbi:MAG: hypothetical protein HY051_00365 [Candidatus Aenigmarchaeota archaeon]|nr:hypothetical protein [Candidatus Aenigmarchaeota archaeon]